jgi:arylsulfatase A-like enzyme
MKQLRSAGYRVAVCGKTDLHKKSHLHGIDGWSARAGQLGFTDAIDMCGKRDSALLAGRDEPIEPYMAWLHDEGVADVVVEDLERRTEQDMDPMGSGRGIDTRPFPLERKYQIDDFCGRRALNLLEDLPREAPWFMQVNWASAHPPFDAARELVARYRDTDFPPPVASRDRITDHQAVRRQYAAMVEGMDEWMGRIIDAVADRAELDDTVIVYSADHGEMLGDHGRWNKGVPLEPSVHIPLIVRGPGVAQNRQSDALVELIDLAATFVDIAGLRVPEEWHARSLSKVLSSRSDEHRHVTVSALGNWQMVFDGRFKYLERRGEPHALYDLIDDPRELSSVLDSSPAAATRLREALLQINSAAAGTTQ